MRNASSVSMLVAIMLVCIVTSGCLSLAMQREMIEDMREEPVLIEKEDRLVGTILLILQPPLIRSYTLMKQQFLLTILFLNLL